MTGLISQHTATDTTAFVTLKPTSHSEAQLQSPTNLTLIGPGKVGGALLDQLLTAQLTDSVSAKAADIRLLAVCRQHTMLTDHRGIELEIWRRQLAETEQASNLQQLTEFLQAQSSGRNVIVDSTASESVARHHVQWLNAGFDVLTANKAGPAGSQSNWDQCRQFTQHDTPPSRYGIETTVGAALPVIDTINKLQQTGDVIRRIDGVFSGSIAWIFNRVDAGDRFSDAIRQAHELGLTEPDPRDDLSGLDIARKLLILARQIGWREELDQVAVPDLLLPSLSACPLDEFFTHLPELDSHLETQIRLARDRGHKLLVDGSIDRDHGLRADLRMLPRDHTFSLAPASDNIIRLFTERYGEHPLIIQGAGAGVELTASGLLTELLQCGLN